MGRLAVVFPGQGSQSVGMGRALAERFAESREVFDAADAALAEPLSHMIFEGPEEKLGLTENTQPAVLTVSVAAWRVLDRRGVSPAFAAGHSLGEYSALVAAGAMDFTSAVRLVRKRGVYMQEAVPVGEGAMAAIIGMDPGEVARACEEAASGDVVSPANLNSPEQTVIAGHAEAVRRAGEICKSRGAKRVVPIPVSAPFHCALMAPAQARLSGEIAAVELRDARIPVVTNAEARPVRSVGEIRDALVRQVTSPVRWVESVHRLVAEGVDAVVEVGPGRVLSGLVKRIDRSVKVSGVDDPASLDETLASLAGRATV